MCVTTDFALAVWQIKVQSLTFSTLASQVGGSKAQDKRGVNMHHITRASEAVRLREGYAGKLLCSLFHKQSSKHILAPHQRGRQLASLFGTARERRLQTGCALRRQRHP